MLQSTILPRIFIHIVDGSEVRLTDPSPKLNPDAVLQFYSGTYPVLTTAKIEGPEIIRDEIQYRFISVLGTKG